LLTLSDSRGLAFMRTPGYAVNSTRTELVQELEMRSLTQSLLFAGNTVLYTNNGSSSVNFKARCHSVLSYLFEKSNEFPNFDKQ
jgi:hypothetical protein